MGENVPSQAELQLAIVGGGIVGVILARGLLRQKISVRLYEQATGFREIGAGIAFSACARQCSNIPFLPTRKGLKDTRQLTNKTVELLDPAIVEALRRSGAVPVSDDGNDNLRWIDGYSQDRTGEEPLAEIGGSGFRGCRRDQFLEELVKGIPDGVIEFRKRLEVLETGGDGKVGLHFADGTLVQADAVIGCDGIKSRVRQQMFGVNHPVSDPQYTHKVAYRGIVPMDLAVAVLGERKAYNFHHQVGPGAHVTHYPVANGTALNVAVFLSDPNQWPDPMSMVAEGTRDEVETALREWHPTLLALIRLLPDKLVKWALFDMGEFPAPYYNLRRVCIAGDAAHASSPHHGAGACLGVEDALCLSVLLGKAKKASENPAEALEAAFETFNAIRRPRTQWLVNSSRRVCDLYHQPEWADPLRWVKAETCFEEIRDRSYKIWHFNVDDMVRQAIADFHRRRLS